jgi:hypothetical protein
VISWFQTFKCNLYRYTSAVFTGPRRLRLAAAMVPAVRVLMWVTAPVSWPLARGLDWLLVGLPLTPGCQIGYMEHTGCHQLNVI